LEGSRPDWQIIQDIANRLGANGSISILPKFIARSLVDTFVAGVTYDRLEGFKSLHWPVAKRRTDQPLLYNKAVCLSGWQSQAVRLSLTEPN